MNHIDKIGYIRLNSNFCIQLFQTGNPKVDTLQIVKTDKFVLL